MQHTFEPKTAVFFMKTMVFYLKIMFFGENRSFTDFGLKIVKLTNIFHSRVRTQGGNINFFLKICKNHGFWPNERPLALKR